MQWKISGQTLFSGQAQVAQKSWKIKNLSIQWKIQGKLYFTGQAQVPQKSRMWKVYSIQWEISGQTVFRISAIYSKILKDKKYFNAGKFFRANASCWKFWMIKTIYSIQIQAHSVFQGKHKLLKNRECKKHIQCSENFQGTLFFSASVKLLKNPVNGKKYIQCSENFQGKRKLLKNFER